MIFHRIKMKTVTKLKLCDRWLGIFLLVMLASGIQLEATSGRYVWSVYAHIIAGIVLTILSGYHIFLHYGYGNWFFRFAGNRNMVTRILWWIFILTAVSGIAATVIWLDGYGHSHFGAVHGKLGFLMVVAGVIHIRKYMRFLFH